MDPLPHILHADVCALFIALTPQKTNRKTHTYRLTVSTTSISLNHISHPSSQNNHPNKTFISVIVHQILWTKHNITIQIIHVEILSNAIANQLAHEGITYNKPNPTPHIHIAHAITYWLKGIPTSKLHGEIHNLQTLVKKCHHDQELQIAKSKFTTRRKLVHYNRPLRLGHCDSC